MPANYDNRNGVCVGDVVEVYEYDPLYDGLIGEVTDVSAERSTLDIRLTELPNKAHKANFRISQRQPMYKGNVRPVNVSNVPEDWS